MHRCDGLLIRKAKESDIPSLDKLNKEMHQHLADLYGIKDIEKEYFTEEDIPNVIVAEEDEKIVGYIVFNEKVKGDEWYGPHIYLEELAVTKQFRNRGIGRELIKRVLEVAERKNVNVVADTFFKNTVAIKFYEKNGFIPFSLILVRDNTNRFKKP